MADNFVTDPGAAGVTFASDDIGGVHYPLTKLTFGALDSQTIASSGTGTDDAGTQRVTLATDIDLPTGPVTNAGTFVVQIDGAALTALQLIDDVVVTLGTDTYTETTTKANVIGAVRNDANGTLVGTDNEIAPLQVNADGALYVHSPNEISTDNSTTATLANDAVYTGTGEDVSQHSVVTITIDSSHDSATDGMTFELSTDNSNWDDVYVFTYTAADGARRFQFPVTAQYFRIVYTNGGTTQTHFRVQTLLHDNTTLTTIHRLNDNTDPDRSAQIVKASIIAQAAGTGDFVAVQSTATGNLKVSLEEVDGAIAGGGTEAAALRVTVANDSTGLLSVDDNGGSLTVDNATLETVGGGTEAAAQRVTIANDSTGVLSVDDNGASLTVDNAALDTVGGGTEAAAQRVTIANDSTGVLTVDDGGGSLTIDGTVTSNAGTGTRTITGDVANDTADSGNPIKVGAHATNSVEGETQVANSDRVDVKADLNGVLLTRNGTTHEENISERVTNTNGTSTDFTGAFAAQGAGNHLYITEISVTNTNATTFGYVDFRDGAAGSVVWTVPAPAEGGAVPHFDPPLKFSDNTAVAFDVSAAITTVIICVKGYVAQG